ncbi:MAG: aspartate aminotransferase family protein [Candidatus Eiseniibacteriota bacterium]
MSKSLFERAKLKTPGGVNSPVRFYNPYPLFISSAIGPKIVTSDHNTLTDYCMGYGAVIFGHAFPDITKAVKSQLDRGNLYCMPTQQEVELAELLSRIIPHAEQVRVMNTGSEATMHAIRLARAFTKKVKIVKFDGCYNCSYDEVLVNAGSGAENLKHPKSEANKYARNTLLLPYNDVVAVEELVKKHDDIACIIVEPVIANIGLITPKQDFLNKLRRITAVNNILLIFDEVVTGFRLSLGGASEYFGVAPDISTFGKAIANGFPISAIAGKKEILENFSPTGTVYQGSTYAGNPISVTASLATVQKLESVKNELYPKMSRLCDSLARGINDSLETVGLHYYLNNIGSMFQLFFTDKKVENAEDARTSNRAQYMELFKHLIRAGIFIPPSQFETCFISGSHTEEDIDFTIDAYSNAFHKVRPR